MARKYLGWVGAVSFFALVIAPNPHALAVDPHRSFERLVTSNGFAVVSYDRASGRIDTFLEHPYRFAEPREDAPDLCFRADESRDLAYDVYFGVRSGMRGEWLGELPLADAAYVPGTGIIHTTQHAGDARGVRVETWSFMSMELSQPALVMVATATNETTAPLPVSLYALFNLHLGDAGGGREPSADAEEVSFDPLRQAMYEYGPSRGTAAYVALSPVLHRSTSTGDASAYNSLRAGRDLDDRTATTGPTSDVAPGMQSAEVLLAPGMSTSMAVAIVWALDEDAGADVDATRAWAGAALPAMLVERERTAWDAWHTAVPAGVDAALWRQSNAFLRMGQVREAGPGHGQILASLPPGLGNVDAQWNIAWVRDMAYASVGLARAGHLDEAHDALEFQVTAPRGRHEAEVGMPYRISITRYFGNGMEESDCNADGPNIEFDGFGLFLWSLGEYLRAGGDLERVRAWYPTVRDEVGDVLVALIDDAGVIRADSSIWEVHWNGRQRRFTYTSLAAARGLCELADVADELGMADDATRYREAGRRVRDSVVRLHTDRRGALAQSAEDLLVGHHYVDAATIEAVNWGIVDPGGRVAQATTNALFDNLVVATGRGLMRNDDGGWYDSQEWVFVDFRVMPALRAMGRGGEAQEIATWLQAQASANDLHFSELHDASTGDYAGSIPMIGFGAGAYLIASTGDALPPACGEYAPEPDPPLVPDAGPPGDTDAGPPPCVGVTCPDASDEGCGCTAPGHPQQSTVGVIKVSDTLITFFGVVVLALGLARRRR